jgi:SAM-dependent methyltransferase
MSGRDMYSRPPARKPRTQTGLSRRALLRLRPSATAQRDIDWEALTDRLRDGWGRDGHEPLLRALAPVSEVLVELAEVAADDLVLDVGAGDGNVAVAAAARGAVVDACDLVPAMVARGQARTTAGVTWRVADAARLPYPDATFDAVLSAFGAAQAPFARQVAAELARVARPGATVALAAWVPRGLPGRLDELVEPHLPLPDGVRVPTQWGVQAVARARLDPYFDDIRLITRTTRVEFPSPDALFDALLRPFPLPAGAVEALRPDLDRLLASCNNRPPAVEIDARYLVALGRRA